MPVCAPARHAEIQSRSKHIQTGREGESLQRRQRGDFWTVTAQLSVTPARVNQQLHRSRTADSRTSVTFQQLRASAGVGGKRTSRTELAFIIQRRTCLTSPGGSSHSCRARRSNYASKNITFNNIYGVISIHLNRRKQNGQKFNKSLPASRLFKIHSFSDLQDCLPHIKFITEAAL